MTVISLGLVLIGTCFIALNYHALLVNYRNRHRNIDRHHSFVPVIGGALAAIGLYLLGQKSLALAAAVIDPGVWVMALFPVALLRQRHGHAE